MSHDHEQAGHSHSPPDHNAVFAIGVLLNIGFVITELLYGLSAHSLALLSDAGHNLSDVFGLLIAWGAVRLGQTLPTKLRTYGLRRASILAALANAVILLIAVGAIIWEALGRFSQPAVVAGSTIIWVAALGVVINAATALLFMKGRERDLNQRGAFLHMAADAAVSLGVVVAGWVIQRTGWLWLDPTVSIVIGLVIIWSIWGLLRESVNLVLDAVPAGIDPQAVENFLATRPAVVSVHDLHIWGMSTTETALTVHLVMPEGSGNDEFLHDLTHALHEQFAIGHVTIQIERGDGECHLAAAEVV